jgi:hypothetical protein
MDQRDLCCPERIGAAETAPKIMMKGSKEIHRRRVLYVPERRHDVSRAGAEESAGEAVDTFV